MKKEEKRKYLLERLALAESLRELLAEILLPFDVAIDPNDIEGKGFSNADDEIGDFIVTIRETLEKSRGISIIFTEYQRECVSQIQQDM